MSYPSPNQQNALFAQAPKGVTCNLRELLAWRYNSKGLTLFNRHAPNSISAGSKRALARGRGMEFEEVRLYQPGDDTRLINWSMAARTGKVYTKVFREERERPIYLVVDLSASMHFGTKVAFKHVVACHLAAILAWSALANQEQVAAIISNGKSRAHYKPRRSQRTVLSILGDLDSYSHQTPESADDVLLPALEEIQRARKSGALVILISDFAHWSDTHSDIVYSLSRKTDFIHLRVHDPLEGNAPSAGLYPFSNGAERFVFDGFDRRQRQAYEHYFSEKRAQLRQKVPGQWIDCATDAPLIDTLNRGLIRYGY